MGGHGPARRPASRRDPPRHGVHRRHGGAGVRPGGAWRGLRDLRWRLPERGAGAGVRAPGPPAAREPSVGGPGGGRRREALTARLRAVEEGQRGRAGVGLPLGSGPTGLAHRVCRHVARPPGRRLRSPRGRPRSGLPPSRERAGPGGRRGASLRPPLGPQRVGGGRRHQDVEVAGQLHLAHRPPGPQ